MRFVDWSFHQHLQAVSTSLRNAIAVGNRSRRSASGYEGGEALSSPRSTASRPSGCTQLPRLKTHGDRTSRQAEVTRFLTGLARASPDLTHDTRALDLNPAY